MADCSVRDCDRAAETRGWCQRHYKRWKATGDPLKTKRPGPKPRSLAERFWEKVDVRGPDECWPWLAASQNDDGYGVIWDTDTQANVRAHAVSFFLANGRWSEIFVCHTCDNPGCVNPAHLFEGTALDNVRDMIAKGRRRNQNVDKTHCLNGHPLSGDNVRVYANGSRHCMKCARQRAHDHYWSERS